MQLAYLNTDNKVFSLVNGLIKKCLISSDKFNAVHVLEANKSEQVKKKKDQG